MESGTVAIPEKGMDLDLVTRALLANPFPFRTLGVLPERAARRLEV